MTQATRALDGGDLSAALRALEANRDRYRNGYLREERDAFWIVALCKQGRMAEADAARRAFELRAPRSPLRARIERQCKLPAR